MIDFESSSTSACSMALYTGTSVNHLTIVGSSTGTTWVHGRAILSTTLSGNFFAVSSVAGTASGQNIVRLTILRLA